MGLKSLSKDMASAVKKQEAFNFKHLLVICATLHTKSKQSVEIDYVKPEDEIFFEECVGWFEYAVPHDMDMEDVDTVLNKNSSPHRRVLILTAAKLNTCIANIETAINQT